MKNIIKGIITSLLGVAIILLTILMILIGSMSWIWEGIAGIVLGVVLLLSPDTLVKNFIELISKFNKKSE